MSEEAGAQPQREPIKLQMTHELADKWSAALRSGKYRQGRGKLYTERHPQDSCGPYHCALGVLADVMGCEWHGSLPFDPTTGEPIGSAHSLALDGREKGGMQAVVIELNDGAKLSFADIAGVVDTDFFRTHRLKLPARETVESV